jgi:restriction system protein
MWQREIRHDGLNKYRLIKGETEAIVNVRAEMQMRIWNEQWLRNTTAEAKRLEKESRAWAKESKKQLAADQTIELQKALQALDTLLSSSLKPKYTIDWSALKNTSAFPISQPVQPALQTALQEPKIDAPCFIPQLNWFTRLIPPIRNKAEATALGLFKHAHQEWERAVTEADRLNRTRAEEFKRAFASWEKNKSEWLEKQATSNAIIDRAEEDYRSGKLESITEYCEMVLHNSEYPDSFPCDAVVAYIPETRTAVVDYSLPDISALPTLKEVKYIAARDAFQNVAVSETWLNRTYDSVLYQIALRTLYELFQADTVNAIDSIVLNGWVTSTDKAIGKQVTGCVLSVHAMKSEFMDVNLDQVEPKACFKKLKGVSAAKLTALQPIRPILQLNKEDKRFISAYGVADTLDNSSNLAAWIGRISNNLFVRYLKRSSAPTEVRSRSPGQAVTEALMRWLLIQIRFVAVRLLFKPRGTLIQSAFQPFAICMERFTMKARTRAF